MPRPFTAALLASLAIAPAPLMAHDFAAPGLTIVHPWARATAPRQPAGGVFMIIENHTDRMEQLTGVSTPLADRADVHNTVNDNGVMRMRPVEVIEIPARDQAELAPGGLHIMLIGLEERLVEGDLVPITLHFENAGDVAVGVIVQGAGAAAPVEAAAPAHDHGQ